MDFALAEHQKLMLETARQIGREFGVEYWRRLDAEKRFPAEMWQAICKAGLCGVALPEAHGGSGLGMLDLALVIEALTEGGAGATLAQVFMVNPIFGGVALSRYASAEMRDAYLPKIISGEINCCMALTEPDAGSNTLEIRTFATPVGNGWRLNGRKVWITAVPDAQKMLVVARTKTVAESTRRTDGISLFFIDVERSGLTFSPIEKVGTHTLSASAVFFDDVKVDGAELIGTLHGGWPELLHVLNTERIVTTAGLVGAARLATRLAVDYARERKVFNGTPIGAYQGLQFPLARATAEIEAASTLNLKAAWKCDQGLPYGSEANMAKVVSARAATDAIERAMQTLGGMGYAKEFHVERLWRDARLFLFAPVSEEMALNFIAVHDLKMPRSY
ncbi:MAG: acyl-CoA/acyl-ACP dehydrogenase [Alphaproteobacteria bacterium]|nr:acyl-CoA/acyl-ACP dehydrogenase [Alphaproteobacteria bacterium]